MLLPVFGCLGKELSIERGIEGDGLREGVDVCVLSVLILHTLGCV